MVEAVGIRTANSRDTAGSSSLPVPHLPMPPQPPYKRKGKKRKIGSIKHLSIHLLPCFNPPHPSQWSSVACIPVHYVNNNKNKIRKKKTVGALLIFPVWKTETVRLSHKNRVG